MNLISGNLPVCVHNRNVYKFHVFVFPSRPGQTAQTDLPHQSTIECKDSWPAQLIVPTTTLSAYHLISAVGGLLLQHFLFNLAIDNGEHEKYYKQNQNDPWVQNTTAAAHGCVPDDEWKEKNEMFSKDL